jgi:chaperonin GroES
MLKPLHDRIIVLPDRSEERSPSGKILLPDTAQEKPGRGTVLAVGPGPLLESGARGKMDVKVDDVVLYGKYAGTEVKIRGEEYIILRQEDVLAVVG